MVIVPGFCWTWPAEGIAERRFGRIDLQKRKTTLDAATSRRVAFSCCMLVMPILPVDCRRHILLVLVLYSSFYSRSAPSWLSCNCWCGDCLYVDIATLVSIRGCSYVQSSSRMEYENGTQHVLPHRSAPDFAPAGLIHALSRRPA